MAAKVQSEINKVRRDRPHGGSLQILNHKEKIVSASRRNQVAAATATQNARRFQATGTTVGASTRKNRRQISIFEIPFLESADPVVDLLTETARGVKRGSELMIDTNEVPKPETVDSELQPQIQIPNSNLITWINATRPTECP